MKELNQLVLNDTYKVLKFIQTNEVNFSLDCFTQLTQNKMGQAMHNSFMKVIMQKLTEHRLISHYNNSKRRYVLSQEIINNIYAITSKEGSINAIK